MDLLISYGLIFLGLAISGWASLKVRSAYSKYSEIKVNQNISGQEVARKILDKNGLSNVYVVEINGQLSDHYDPKRKVVRLSNGIFHGNSVASIAVAAHEVGHALQDKDDYSFMRIRSAMVPFVNLTTNVGYIMIVISFIAGILELFSIGIGLFSLSLVFQLVTLPVEIDASRRAEQELAELTLFNDKELKQSKSMLFAAAMTYVASVITTSLQILRLVLLSRSRD